VRVNACLAPLLKFLTSIVGLTTIEAKYVEIDSSMQTGFG
jgi:hypothetical protein